MLKLDNATIEHNRQEYLNGFALVPELRKSQCETVHQHLFHLAETQDSAGDLLPYVSIMDAQGGEFFDSLRECFLKKGNLTAAQTGAALDVIYSAMAIDWRRRHFEESGQKILSPDRFSVDRAPAIAFYYTRDKDFNAHMAAIITHTDGTTSDKVCHMHLVKVPLGKYDHDRLPEVPSIVHISGSFKRRKMRNSDEACQYFGSRESGFAVAPKPKKE